MATKHEHFYSTFSASTVSAPISPAPHQTKPNKCSKCCCFLCRFSTLLVLHPAGPFRCLWDMIVMVLLIYTAVEIPYTMAFPQNIYILYFGLFVDAMLFIDILLNFHTAYFDKYDNLKLVTNKKYICKKYIRTWFFIDLLTCLPYDFMHPKDNSTPDALNYIKALRIFRLLRIIKMLRLLKMVRIFDVFRKQFIVREVIIGLRIFKLLCGMLLFAHFAACLWYFVGEANPQSWIDAQGIRSDDIGTFSKYSYAWYWSVVTLFTTGYGDITATNTTEQWVSSICILIGTCFFAYFVGTLTVLITEGDKIKSYEIDKLEEAHLFCEKKRLPKELTHAICTHVRYHCQYNYVFDETELLSILPSYLQIDIHTCVAKQFLSHIGMFQNEYIHLPDSIVGLIAVKCRAISCNQLFKLYDIGDLAREFYIQRTGKSVVYDKNGLVKQELSRGSVCGEYSSILFKKRKLRVETETWSEFYAISIDDIKQVLDEYYPRSSHLKWKKIQKYMKMKYESNTSEHFVRFKEYTQENSSSLPPLHTILTNAGSNSLIKNRKQSTADSLSKIHETVTDHTPISETKNEKTVNKFAKFKIRSNSEVRNFVVTKHGLKHNRLSSVSMTNNGNMGHIRAQSADSMDPKNDLYRSNTVEMAIMEINKSKNEIICERKQSDTIYDSEYSLSLSSESLQCMDSDSETQTQTVKHHKIPQRHKRVRVKKKRRKMGKFGGRRSGNMSGKYRGNNMHGLHRQRTDKEKPTKTIIKIDHFEGLMALNDEENITNTMEQNEDSIDSTVLLETLGVSRGNECDNGNNLDPTEHLSLVMIPSATNSVHSDKSDSVS